MAKNNMQLWIFVFVSLQPLGQSLQVNFFKYGSRYQDESLPRGNDETASLQLPDGVILPYYGGNYSTVHIQTNGLLSLNRPVPDPQTNKLMNNFPLSYVWDGLEQEVDALIAPFWADVDTTGNRGDVYYRQSEEGDDLKNVTALVREHFPRYPIFEAAWVSVVTWHNVSFFDHDNTSSKDPRNTFQAVLTTNGDSSFVFFFYDEIRWTTGTTLEGDASTGRNEDRPGFQAIVGFNKGDANTKFIEGFPEKRMVLNVKSNVAQLGTYAFQVDADVKGAGCSNEDPDIAVYPSHGSANGGEKIYLSGPCWNESSSLLCEFWTTDSNHSLLQRVNGTIRNNVAYCVPGNFSVYGDIQIKVSVDGGDSFAFFGDYAIYPESTTADMTTSSPPPDSGMEGWLIAIIIIASILAICGIVAIAYVAYTRYMKKTRGEKIGQEDKDVHGGTMEGVEL